MNEWNEWITDTGYGGRRRSAQRGIVLGRNKRRSETRVVASATRHALHTVRRLLPVTSSRLESTVSDSALRQNSTTPTTLTSWWMGMYAGNAGGPGMLDQNAWWTDKLHDFIKYATANKFCNLDRCCMTESCSADHKPHMDIATCTQAISYRSKNSQHNPVQPANIVLTYSILSRQRDTPITSLIGVQHNVQGPTATPYCSMITPQDRGQGPAKMDWSETWAIFIRSPDFVRIIIILLFDLLALKRGLRRWTTCVVLRLHGFPALPCHLTTTSR